MTMQNKKHAAEANRVELPDLLQEVSEQQMKNVKGGDFHMSTRVIVKKVTIRP
ncbi:hypothetical protein PAESOLCIP111_01237 [Paenibacillus solanacearum]|uniref:Uncharacterized protein n=1 Tax=Paenibacillus solanacearum TaxID=2048548 RepID=A0A916JWB2_9BACL|nr:hypothetical protein [Paenibacillus solanacearum]CAG7610407.1 hypothetical protein PAESOLCIP111_01237 [Paenibacillus solanacearum]